LTVLPVNDAPVFTGPPGLLAGQIAVLTETTLTFTVAVSDVDGPELSLSAAGLPPGATFDAETAAFSWSPSFEDAGQYSGTFTVDDSLVQVDAVVTITADSTDSDGDGLPDAFEINLGLNHEDRDSDGDGSRHTDEQLSLADPGNADGDDRINALDDDSDGDGIPDAVEAGDEDLDTPPVDTDENGVPDFLDADSDGDGVDDATDNCRVDENEDQADLD